MLNRSNVRVCGLALAGALTTTVFGQEWSERGEAPELLPGQETLGSNPLTLINGRLNIPYDVDLYCIHIVDVSQFRASTVGLSEIDTQLFLFDEDGLGITMNDDEVDGESYQSTITGQFVPGPGYYVLAISSYNNDPLRDGLWIWEGNSRLEHPADGPGAPGPVDAWNHQSFDGPGPYSIALNGAEFSNLGGGGYRLSIDGACPGLVTLSWSGATAHGRQGLIFGAHQGSTTIPSNLPCAGTVLHVVGNVHLLQPPGYFSTGSNGSGSISGNAGSGACGAYFQLLQGGVCRMSNVSQLLP